MATSSRTLNECKSFLNDKYQDGDKINKEIVDCFSPSSRDLFPQKQNTSRANTEHKLIVQLIQ